MKLYKQFEKFAVKGNMVDIALGIAIGSAFMETVGIFVKSIILPPATILLKSVELKDKKIDLGKNIFLEYGIFLESFLSFIIIGIFLFVILKIINHIRDKAFDINNKTVDTPKDIELLSKILKELQKNN